MKIKIPILVLITTFLFSVSIIKAAGTASDRQNSVDIFSGDLVCSDPFWCHHEKGHLLDMGDNGIKYWNWKSADPIFIEAIEAFLSSDQVGEYQIYESTINARFQYEFQFDNFGFWFRERGIRSEILADIIALSGGHIEKMPPAFRDYFTQFKDEIPVLTFAG